MSDTTEVNILVAIRKDIEIIEKEIARGKYENLHELTKVQGYLFGLERALAIAHNIISEKEDRM
jgi:hypothetical protein